MIKTVKAIADLGQTKDGVNKPVFIRCDDRKVYVVKFLDEKKTLINEIVGGILSSKVELTSPNLAFVDIDNDFLELSSQLKERKISPGIHLGVERIDNVCYFNQVDVRKILPYLSNVRDIYGVTCIDNWVLNDDRNNWGNNLIEIVDSTKYIYHVIDFSHCFYSDDWNAHHLDTIMDVRKMVRVFQPFVQYMNDDNEYESWILKIENCEQSVFNNLGILIPNSWKLSEQDKNKLVDVLSYRKKLVRDMLIMNGVIAG